MQTESRSAYLLLQKIRALLSGRSDSIAAGASRLPTAIALTTYASEVDQQCALAVGFQKQLPKPMA